MQRDACSTAMTVPQAALHWNSQNKTSECRRPVRINNMFAFIEPLTHLRRHRSEMQINIRRALLMLELKTTQSVAKSLSYRLTITSG